MPSDLRYDGGHIRATESDGGQGDVDNAAPVLGLAGDLDEDLVGEELGDGGVAEQHDEEDKQDQGEHQLGHRLLHGGCWWIYHDMARFKLYMCSIQARASLS